MPFSYIIGDGRDTYIVPGRNITTVGVYRDIRKWPRRDVRLESAKKSIVNYDWLSPLTVNEIVKGRQLLADLRQNASQNTAFYTLNGNKLSTNSLQRGIKLYSMAIELFIGEVLMSHDFGDPCTASGAGEWHDLSGLLLPAAEEDRLVEKIKYGVVDSVKALSGMLEAYNDRYGDYLWTFTVSLMKDYLGTDELTEDSGKRRVDKQQGTSSQAFVFNSFTGETGDKLL